MSISIPRLQNSSTASADTFNAPLSAIELELNNIHRILSTVVNKNSIIASDIRISSDCFTGCLVYFDYEDKVCRPAIATVDASDLSYGDYINNPKSCVLGMLISKSDNGVTGSVLISGQYKDALCVSQCLEESVPGTFYLSDKYIGKATNKPEGPVRQPVLTYLGDGEVIINITQQPPYQYSDSYIRGISASGMVTATVSDDGVARIHSKYMDKLGAAYSNTAVSAINGAGYNVTPVITDIVGVGNSIKVKKNIFGEAYIGLPSEFGTTIEAESYNLNGTKRVSDDIFTYIVFPGGRTGSVTFSSHVCTGSPINVCPWIHAIGSEAISMGYTIYFLEDPAVGSEVAISSIPSISGTIRSESGRGTLALASGSSNLNVSSSGTIIVKLTGNPTGDFKILRAGISIEPSSAEDIISSMIPTNEYTGSSGEAAEIIPRYSVVGYDSEGKIVKASCNAPNIPVCGVSMNDVEENGICKFVTSGKLVVSDSLVYGASYYVGLDGELTTVAPDLPSYMQRIGTAVSTNILMVDIEEMIE